eukprot:2500956-Rhodomonas_salina.1
MPRSSNRSRLKRADRALSLIASPLVTSESSSMMHSSHQLKMRFLTRVDSFGNRQFEASEHGESCEQMKQHSHSVDKLCAPWTRVMYCSATTFYSRRADDLADRFNRAR